jgi:aminoglycoside phosphotransferase (APT) family kinase protein
MHDDQLPVALDRVRLLVREQFPEWAREPITAVAGSGTVNAIFRIGTGLAARFPLRAADPAGSQPVGTASPPSGLARPSAGRALIARAAASAARGDMFG